ncbi:MAG: HAD family hydrolase [Bacteroidota bacterium]
MAKSKTLYVSDLDGTLLNHNAILSEYTKSGLNKLISRGINFTVASGRTIDAAKEIMADIELNIPIISFNGAIIYDVKQKSPIKVYWLTAEAVKNIVAVLKSHNVSALIYEFKDDALRSYYESLEQKPLYDYVADRKARYNSIFRQVNDFGEISSEQIMYFTLLDTYDRVKPVYDGLKKIPDINMSMVNNTYSKDLWFLEIFNAGASKENAVRFLRETYGYRKVIGFGDNHNDLPMFKVCDLSVAVKNANDEVKAAADCICESYDEDGVVKWIEDHECFRDLAG